MKERLFNVLAWLAWVWAVGVILFFIAIFLSGFYDEMLIEGKAVAPSLYVFFAGACALVPLIFQWVLFYVITGSPRFLPWQYPEQAVEE